MISSVLTLNPKLNKDYTAVYIFATGRAAKNIFFEAIRNQLKIAGFVQKASCNHNLTIFGKRVFTISEICRGEHDALTRSTYALLVSREDKESFYSSQSYKHFSDVDVFFDSIASCGVYSGHNYPLHILNAELKDSKIILYGCAKYAMGIISAMRLQGLKTVGCFDSDDTRIGEMFEGIRVGQKAELAEALRDPELSMVITSRYWKKIVEGLGDYRCRLYTDIYEFNIRRGEILEISSEPFLRLSEEMLKRLEYYCNKKRVFVIGAFL